MFAAIGYIVPEYFKWPGDLSPKLGLKFADIPNGLAAISKAWEVGRDVQHDQSICCDLLSAAYIVHIYIYICILNYIIEGLPPMPPTPSVCELQTRQRVAFFVLESFPAQRPESLTAAY